MKREKAAGKAAGKAAEKLLKKFEEKFKELEAITTLMKKFEAELEEAEKKRKMEVEEAEEKSKKLVELLGEMRRDAELLKKDGRKGGKMEKADEDEEEEDATVCVLFKYSEAKCTSPDKQHTYHGVKLFVPRHRVEFLLKQGAKLVNFVGLVPATDDRQKMREALLEQAKKKLSPEHAVFLQWLTDVDKEKSLEHSLAGVASSLLVQKAQEEELKNENYEGDWRAVNRIADTKKRAAATMKLEEKIADHLKVYYQYLLDLDEDSFFMEAAVKDVPLGSCCFYPADAEIASSFTKEEITVFLSFVHCC